MQFLKSVCNLCPLLPVLILAASFSNPPGATASDSPWQWQPWVSVGGGQETDLILDPEFTRTPVPGGAFLEVAPGFRLTRRLSPGTAFRLLNRTAVDRFFNSDGRLQFGTLLYAELNLGQAVGWGGRLRLNGDYFSDSGSSTFRRYGGGGEAAVAYRGRRAQVEAAAFVQGRTYPDIDILLVSGSTADYGETHHGASLGAAWRPTPRLLLEALLTGRFTRSDLAAYEAGSVTATANAECLVADGTWLSAVLTGHSRQYDNRIAGEDGDSYYQYGVGLGRRITPRVTLVGRYAFAKYTYTLGETESTTRVSLSATWQFGRRAPLIRRADPPGTVYPGRASMRTSPVLLRIKAPSAVRVAVAGSFNGWNPDTHLLQAADGGWWELRVSLPPGTHVYTYLVDGEAVTPRDADRTVDDGFGGRNGVIEIEAESP